MNKIKTMKQRKIKASEKELFLQLQNMQSSGFWSDSISIDKTMIEANFCPCCHRSLTYQGWSNVAEYQAFGVCKLDEYAKLFWTEKAPISSFKKKVCNAVKKAA